MAQSNMTKTSALDAALADAGKTDAGMARRSMDRSAAAASDFVTSALHGTLVQLQVDTLAFAITGLFGGGLGILALALRAADPAWGLFSALTMFACLFCAWWLRSRSVLAASILVVIAAFTGVVTAAVWGGIASAVCLLAIPVGLTTVLFGTRWGVMAATLCTMGVLGAEGFGAASIVQEVRVAGVILIWATVALLWIALRTLFTAVEWAWLHSEKSQVALEEARDAQVQVRQVLEDLSAANLQLTRLNQLAHSLRETAESARRAKEEFVANVSHELRTPLNMIIGFSRMIVETPQVYGRNPIPPALMSDLTVILRNSQHLSNLVDDVLDLSQIEADKMAITKERTEIREIVETAVTVVRPLFESKQFYLETEIEEGIPSLLMDRTRIREVLLNLLSNAGRFTEQGGVHIQVEQSGGEVVVRVRDTGPGIAEGDIPKLFQPFQQLDHSLSRRNDGTGLGLTLSKRFVELHGGRMWLESRPGSGSTFIFTLPIDAAPTTTESPARWLTPGWSMLARTRPSLAPVAETKPRFVVVDKAGTLSRLIMRYLDGCEVVSVLDMDAAVQELAETPAHALLVADPESEQDGHWANVALPGDVPVIHCPIPATGRHAAFESVNSNLSTDMGPFTDYLVKPISREELLAVIVNALQQRGAPGKHPATVLLVDDEPDELRLFWRMLSLEGGRFRILTANNGLEALEILREERPDVVISDLVMPEMDGFQLVAARNADPALREIPLVILSARDPQGHPIVSESITATLSGGLSALQVLACIEALSAILSPLPVREVREG